MTALGPGTAVRQPPGVSVAPPIPVGRRAVLYAVRRIGDATVEEVAADLGITASGARQHLSSLAEHDLVEAVEVRDDTPRRGRPRLTYHVTELGDLLFPKAYGSLTNELLGYVAEGGEAAIDRLFERRRDHRIANATARMSPHASLSARVAELTRILDDDGYLAEFEQLSRDHFLVIEHNCAIAAVACTYGQACSSELEFIRAVLPDTEVTRVSHMASGDRRCAYDIRRRRQSAD
jgi:DeoR family transcriptional regulator, suf operon transcriptional repressor